MQGHQAPRSRPEPPGHVEAVVVAVGLRPTRAPTTRPHLTTPDQPAPDRASPRPPECRSSARVLARAGQQRMQSPSGLGAIVCTRPRASLLHDGVLAIWGSCVNRAVGDGSSDACARRWSGAMSGVRRAPQRWRELLPTMRPADWRPIDTATRAGRRTFAADPAVPPSSTSDRDHRSRDCDRSYLVRHCVDWVNPQVRKRNACRARWC